MAAPTRTPNVYTNETLLEMDQVQLVVNNIYDGIKEHVNTAVSKALGQGIGATIGAGEDIVEPGIPPEPLTDSVTSLLSGLDDLKEGLLDKPNFPNFDYTGPDLPDLDTNPPALTNVVIPDSPDINIPQFTAEMEDETVVNPDVTYEFAEIEYTSDLRDALYDQMYSEILNGGYGINDDDESRLFERAREREQRAVEGAIDGAIRLYSSNGFTMPTGAAVAAVQRAQQDMRDKVSTLNRDIMLERSKLYLEGKRMVEANTIEMEKLLMGFHSSKMDRALKSASDRVAAMIQIAGFQLERLKIYLEKYKVLAQVFDTKVKAELAKAEIFGKQIDAARAQVEVNLALLKEFTARNDAIIAVFLGQVEEFKARIDGYTKYIGALADQYRAEATAFAAVYDGYGKVYDMKARIHGNNVDYWTAIINARVAAVRNKLEREIADANLEVEAEKAKATIAAQVASAALSALNYNATISAQASTSENTSHSTQNSTQVSTNYNISA